MRFKLSNPISTSYDFYMLSLTPEVEDEINRLGPVKVMTGAYDWPNVFGGYQGWTDSINSIWWPQLAEQFATCIVVIDDARNDLLNQSILAQRAAVSSSEDIQPYVIISALLSPPEEGRPGEQFPPTGVSPVSVETPLIEWKMYPLAPINLTSLGLGETYRGMWLLPLVDIRYFHRNTALNITNYGSYSDEDHAGYPHICAGNDDYPGWMPPLLAYPKDASTPLYYTPIVGMGVQPTIDDGMAWAPAVDLQCEMNSLRVVNRDVRSNYSNISSSLSHNSFTGIVVDYPEDYSGGSPVGYHQDAMTIFNFSYMRVAGGKASATTLQEFIASKLQFIFESNSSDCFFSLTLRTTANYPVSVADFVEDTDGPSVYEKTIVPCVLLGLKIQNRDPTTSEKTALLAAAKQFFLMYCWWKRDQTYMRYPGIVPVIPNGHAATIRWDFQSNNFVTTYVALEGIEGSTEGSKNYTAKRLPFYARIDGEGSVNDGLQGVYAYTELTDANGTLYVASNARKGYVKNVQSSFVTLNPARDLANKVAVPVGLTVRIIPGKTYLDATTGAIFDHYLFETTDLMEVIRVKIPYVRNAKGHYKITIMRYNPDLNIMEFSKDAWALDLP